MNRFYIEKRFIGPREIKITDAGDVRHLLKALRMKEGESLLVSDGEGQLYLTRIEQVTKRNIILEIEERKRRCESERQRIRITLAPAIPKNKGFEDIVDKGTQLGVCEIIPLLTERTLVEKDAFEKKRQRFRRIMIAAAKQSGVLFLPEVKAPVSFGDLIKTTGQYDLSLIPNLSSRSLNLKDAVLQVDSQPDPKGGRRILVLIGPEGDFTQTEIDAALKAGCRGIDLGDSVLRVDTAAVAVVSYLRLFFK